MPFFYRQGTNEDRAARRQWWLLGLMQPLQQGTGGGPTPLQLCEGLRVGMGMEMVGTEAFLSTWLLRGSISTGSGDGAKHKHCH